MSKKHPAVKAAEEAIEKKREEVAEAEELGKRLRDELGACFADLRKAQELADSDLPRCVCVVRKRGEIQPGETPLVILRKTPGGLLVTRHYGGTPELRFKWWPYSGCYVQAEKSSGFYSGQRELRDVPPEFMPRVAEAA